MKSDMNKQTEQPSPTCHSCQTEINPSEMLTQEVVDYLLHFCGYACYAEWRASGNPDSQDHH
ncbi:MAG: DUF3330 domain-containing protein [Proteobacteria bacterium]|nr:MAG: DUF3330 domain-containing protein [Pseudomonadota bacterium]QKK12430.1 MAG: DUF3330 domain-containing protein [Pseudomonadota bacterium]